MNTSHQSEFEDLAQSEHPGANRKRGSFGGDVLKLVSGTAFAQGLVILASPILTRLYGPEAFGVAALFTSVVGIVTVVSCLRYELSIMLPETDEEAANLLGVSLGFVILITLLTIPVAWLGNQTIAGWLNAPELARYLWLLPPATFFGGVFLGLNYWNSRTRQFGRLSVATVFKFTATTGTQLGAGYAGFAYAGSLMIASVVGSALSALVLGGQIWRDDRHLFTRSIRPKEILCGINRHRKFPIYSTWSALLNTISWQLPTFLLATFFSATVVGYYALGTRLLRLPMDLLGKSIAQVFFPNAAAAKADGTLPELVESTFRRLVLFGLFPLLLLTIMGRDLFVVFFGPGWAEAGVYTQILSIWTFFWFVSSPMSTLFSVLEKQEFSLALNVVIFSTRLVSLGIGGWVGNARLALVLFAVSGVLVYGYMCFVIMSAAGVSWIRAAKIVLSNLITFVPAATLLLSLAAFGVVSPVRVGTAIVLLGGYGLYLVKVSPGVRSALGRVLRTSKWRVRGAEDIVR